MSRILLKTSEVFWNLVVENVGVKFCGLKVQESGVLLQSTVWMQMHGK